MLDREGDYVGATLNVAARVHRRRGWSVSHHRGSARRGNDVRHSHMPMGKTLGDLGDGVLDRIGVLTGRQQANDDRLFALQADQSVYGKPTWI